VNSSISDKVSGSLRAARPRPDTVDRAANLASVGRSSGARRACATAALRRFVRPAARHPFRGEQHAAVDNSREGGLRFVRTDLMQNLEQI